MALDPLKFAIAIDAKNLKSQIDEARKTIMNGLKDVPITVQIANLNEIQSKLNDLKVNINASGGTTGGLDKLEKALEQLRSTLEGMGKSSGASGGMKEAATSAEKYAAAVRAAEAAMKRLSDAETQRSSVGGKMADGIESTKQRLAELYIKMQNADTTNKATITALTDEWRKLEKEVDKVAKKQEQMNSKAPGLNASEASKYAQQMESAKRALFQVNELLEKMKANVAKAGSNVDTSGLQNLIAKLEQYKQTLVALASGSQKTLNFKNTMGADFFNTRDLAKQTNQTVEKQIKDVEKALKEEAKASKDSEGAKQSNAAATQRLTLEEQRLAQAINHTSQESHKQSQVLSDLKSMAAQYLSVYAGQQFLNNIIEIGGQLEMQRLSIGAILQDTAHANDLFDRIKSLALQSPFGVVELDQFTKQLSAYGFKYNELFDMTKRLADISAGAGTDVSRLALALGHVRAEGALTGYTLRQFAMNNIPMLGKLSEKLSELEGRFVSASEVRKRVREKDIDYAMVESVIKDLTNEGGMFYNMQEVISGSVKAKWKNLHDAFDIMFGEMAESAVGGVLKDTATLLTALAKKWKELGAVLISVAAVYGGSKAAMLVYNLMLGKQSKAVFATIAANRQAEVSKLRLAKAYRKLTIEEKASLMLTKNQLRQTTILQVSKAISTKKLTAEELARTVALGKMTKAEAKAAIMGSKLDMVQKSQMMSIVAGVRTYKAFTGVINGLSIAFNRLWATLKMVFTNPMAYIMAAVSAGMYVWQKQKDEVERASELGKQMQERASEGLKNIRTMMGETGIKYMSGDKDITNSFGNVKGGTIKITPSSELDGDAMMQVMERWETFLKDNAGTPNEMLRNMFRDDNGEIRDLADQYDRLAESVQLVMHAYEELDKLGDVQRYAMEATGGEGLGRFIDEDITTNINDYSKAVRAYNDSVTKMQQKHRGALIAALNAAKGEKTFADGLQIANEAMQEKESRNLTETEQLQHLIDNTELYSRAVRLAEQAIGDTGDKGGMKSFSKIQERQGDVSDKQETMDKDLDKYVDAAKVRMGELGWDFNHLTEIQRQTIILMLNDMVNKSGEATEQVKDRVKSLAAEKFGITLDINEQETIQRINLVTQELNKLVNPENDKNKDGWVIDIKGAVNANDILQKIREAYKKAQDTVTNFKPVLIKMGITMGVGKILSESEIDAMSGGSVIRKMILTAVNNAYKQIAQAEQASKEYGFSLSDPNPGGKVFRDKKGKDKKEGKTEDKEAKEWKERIRQLKDARNWYDKWEKEIGHTTALERVREQFKGLIDPKDIETLEAYAAALDRILQAARARRARNGGKDERAEEVERQAIDEKEALKLLIFQRNSENFLSSMKRGVDSLTRQWDIFNNVLDATGDRMLAIRLSGLTDKELANDAATSAESIMNKIDDEMSSTGRFIDFDEIFGMSDKEIEKYVTNMLGGTEYADKIKGIIELLKEWQKLQKDVVKDDALEFAKAAGAAVDLQTQVAKVNREYEKTMYTLLRMLNLGDKPGGISRTEYDKMARVANTTRDDKILKLSNAYQMFVNNVATMSKQMARDVRREALDILERKVRDGIITAKEYADGIEDVNKRMQEIEGASGYMRSYVEGGLNGLFSNLQNQGKGKAYEGGQMMQDAQRILNNKSKEGTQEWANAIQNFSKGKEMSAIGNGMQKMGGKMMNTVAIIDMIIHGINNLVQGMKNAVDQITEMREALGYEDDARTGWGKASGFMSTFAAASSQATSGWDSLKNGDAGGVISGVVGSWTQWFTGFAKMSDAQHDAEIKESEKHIKALEMNTEAINKARERELGYDAGRIRKQMQQMYNPLLVEGGVSLWNGSSQKAMYDYYSGSGYEQEYENLKKQREEYLSMYDQEAAKKNKSQEALDGYTQKIAELDDKIKFYSEDLAKTLWGIDLKGWADQIGDALTTAFENGTSAALAYEDAVQNIMRSVVKEMLKTAILEPMMDKLRTTLFGENGILDPSEDMGLVLAKLGEFFGEGGEGQLMITGATEFLNGAEELMYKNYGISMKSNNKASQTSGIQSQATEESIGIVSGQLARIAQDVSVKRIFVTQLVTDQMPRVLENIQIQRVATENQLQSVRAIEHMMSDGAGAMYESIDRMSRKIDRAITPDGRMRIE